MSSTNFNFCKLFLSTSNNKSIDNGYTFVLLSLSMKAEKDKAIYVRADQRLVQRLRRVAQRIDRPSSQIVREAVKAELDRIEGKAK